MKQAKNHILMTGGGTLGPVVPLLAVADVWKALDPTVKISWVGTPKGPERDLIEAEGYEFTALRSPKLARDKKWTWPFVPVLLGFSVVRAYARLKKEKPALILTAGGFVSVPFAIAGKMLGIPLWVHQLDREVGIANKLMAPLARRVSVTWMDNLENFAEAKTLHVGAVNRPNLIEKPRAEVMRRLGLDATRPTVFVFGGGTGAQSINEIMEVIADDLLKEMNVIHLTGKGKLSERLLGKVNYLVQEFATTEMIDFYSAADVVVARAGMGTILQVSALGKPSIFIPIANADQQSNARMLEERDAAKIIWKLNGQVLLQEIRKLVQNEVDQRKYAENSRELFPFGGEKKIVEAARELLDGQKS